MHLKKTQKFMPSNLGFSRIRVKFILTNVQLKVAETRTIRNDIKDMSDTICKFNKYFVLLTSKGQIK